MDESAAQILALADKWGPIQFLVVVLVVAIVAVAGSSLWTNWRLIMRMIRDRDRDLAIKIQLRDALKALRRAITGL